MLLLPSTRGGGVLDGSHGISSYDMNDALSEDKPQLCIPSSPLCFKLLCVFPTPRVLE